MARPYAEPDLLRARVVGYEEHGRDTGEDDRAARQDVARQREVLGAVTRVVELARGHAWPFQVVVAIGLGLQRQVTGDTGAGPAIASRGVVARGGSERHRARAGGLEIDLNRLLFAAGDAHHALLAAAIRGFDRERTLAFVDVDGRRQGRDADPFSVDVNRRARDVDGQLQVRDAALQLRQVVLDDALPFRLDVLGAVFQVTRQGVACLDVLVQLEIALRDVVQDLEVGLDGVGALELHQRR